jgi:uncharacterized protein YciI
MEYFFYCRAKPDSEALWAQLTEAHWSFMDRYADAMIARGPTLAADRATATGSMHMVELPNAAAARVFAFEEPCYVAGVYSEVMVRRWRNTLGRTMWEFDGDAVANHASSATAARTRTLSAPYSARLNAGTSSTAAISSA